MLSPLNIAETNVTPRITLDAEKGIFEIRGRSMPENPNKVYNPVKEWILEYIKSPNKITEFNCYLEYLNSASSKKIFEIFTNFEGLKEVEVNVNWYYEADDSLIESKGQELKFLLDIPFNVIEEE